MNLLSRIGFRDQTVGKMQLAIQLAGFRAIASHRSTASLSDLSVSHAGQEYAFESALNSLTDAELSEEYRRWASASIVRDLVEDFSIFLFDLYCELRAGVDPASNPPSEDEFERKGVISQLDALSDCFDIDPMWIGLLRGYNSLRNCLAHRSGKVSDRDKNAGDALTINWLAMRVARPGEPRPDGEILFEQLLGDGSFPLRAFMVRGEKRFPVGSIIDVGLEELFQICGTFQVAITVFESLRPGGQVTAEASPNV